jgi:hypothetical protein
MTEQQIIIRKNTPWKERIVHAHQVKGGVWYNQKTDNEVTVIRRIGNFELELLHHKTGRKTRKFDHYFIGDYYNTK